MQDTRSLRGIGIVTGLGLALALSFASPRGFAQDPATFTFAAAGDFTNNSNFHTTANAVQAHKPDFLIGLGDYSYSPTGEQDWCNYWKELKFTNLLLVAGNHDTGESFGGSIDDYIKYCGIPFKNIVGKYGRQYYFDYPATSPLARFILVIPGIGGNTGGLDTDYAAGRAGFKFTAAAIDDARAKGIAWIFVGMHKNYISTLHKENEITTDAKHTFVTMLFDKRVDVILQGHEHGYERTKQLATNPKTCPLVPVDEFKAECVVDSGDKMVKGAGTVIHVLGTGGKDMRALEEGDSERPYFVERFAYNKHEAFGFGSFTVTPTTLTFTYIRSAGPELNDTFTIAGPDKR